MRTLNVIANQFLVDLHTSTIYVRHEEKYSVYPIVWVEDKQRRGEEYVGYCSLTKKVYAVTHNPFTVIVVNDFIIDNKNVCEEGERCLNVLCKYNKTTPKSFAKANSMKPKCLERKWTKLVAYWSQFNLSDIFGSEFKITSRK